MYLVISTSLSSDSRSRILARAAFNVLHDRQQPCEFLDLFELRLPSCDAGECYTESNVVRAADLIEKASGILLAAPVYNFDVSAAAKNLVELTGRSWMEKVVGFLCAAGGAGSYMSVLGLANSLMLDFRCLILPRFVFTTGDAIQASEIADLDVQRRVEELVDELIRVTAALKSHGAKD